MINKRMEIKDVENNKTYPSIDRAAKMNGLLPSEIIKCVNKPGSRWETLHNCELKTVIEVIYVTKYTPVMSVTTDKKYRSILDAAETNGTTTSRIKAVINTDKKAVGQHWKVYDIRKGSKIYTFVKTEITPINKKTPIYRIDTEVKYKTVLDAASEYNMTARQVVRSDKFKVVDVRVNKRIIKLHEQGSVERAKTAMIKKYGSLENFRLTQFA